MGGDIASDSRRGASRLWTELMIERIVSDGAKLRQRCGRHAAGSDTAELAMRTDWLLTLERACLAIGTDRRIYLPADRAALARR
ncbi:MAG: hypothetical protein ACLT76_11865 [Clostridium fessum]